jgi:hypothetical protein
MPETPDITNDPSSYSHTSWSSATRGNYAVAVVKSPNSSRVGWSPSTFASSVLKLHHLQESSRVGVWTSAQSP